MRRETLNAERKAYEAAAKAALETLKAGDPNNTLGDAVAGLREAMHRLRKKVEATLPAEGRDRAEADCFLEGLEGTMPLYGMPDYARAIIDDVERHEVRTVAELLAFMLKFGLVFGSAEGSREGTIVFTTLFPALARQGRLLDVAGTSAGPVGLEQAILGRWSRLLPNSQTHPDFRILPGGKLGQFNGRTGRWTLEGNRLTVEFATVDPRGELVRITAFVSPDGRSYEGTYRNGYPVSGMKQD
jgi:hypothetical protein